MNILLIINEKKKVATIIFHRKIYFYFMFVGIISSKLTSIMAMRIKKKKKVKGTVKKSTERRGVWLQKKIVEKRVKLQSRAFTCGV